MHNRGPPVALSSDTDIPGVDVGYRNTAGGSTARKATARNISARNSGLLAAALLLTSVSSCAAPPQEGPTSSASTRQWASYTTTDGSLRFEHPTDWDIREVPALANDPAGGVSLEVLDDGGRVLARLDTGIITDQSCTRLPNRRPTWSMRVSRCRSWSRNRGQTSVLSTVPWRRPDRRPCRRLTRW